MPLLGDTLITLLIFSIGAALGRRLLRWMRVPLETPLEKGVFATTLGLGLLSYLPFVFFALGIGKPAVIAGATLLLFLLLLPEEVRILHAAWRGLTTGLRDWRKGGVDATYLLALAMTPKLLVVFLKSLCPPTDPDGLHYHLTAPLHYLDAGRFEYVPSYLHLNWPLGIEMLFGIGMAFHRFFASSPIEFGFGILLMLSLYAFGRRIASPLVGWLAATLGFALVRGLMSWAYIDVGLCQYTLLSVFALYLGWQSKEQNEQACVPWWRVSALLAGIMAAAKLTGIVWLVLLAFITLLLTWGALPNTMLFTTRLQHALRPALGYAVIGLLFVLPWYVRCWAMTGDPLYPFLWKFFHPIDWDADAAARLNEYLKYFITLPSKRLSPSQVTQVKLIGSAMTLGIGGIFLSRRATRPVLPLALFVFVGLALQIALGGIYLRYLFPLLIPLALLTCWILQGMLRRFPQVGIVLAAVLALVLWGFHKAPGQIREAVGDIRETLPVTLGQVSREDYLTARIPNFAILEWANQNLPPDANLVMGVWHAAYGSLLQRHSMYTNPWLQNAIRFTDWEVMLSDLQRYHATHLLLEKNNDLTPERYKTMSREEQVRATIEFPKLDRLRSEYGIPVKEMGNYVIYALHVKSQ